MKKIVLTGGGTAGHVTPNLALIPSLRERGYDIQYIGSYQGIEKKLRLPECADINLFSAPPQVLSKFKRLPEDLDKAKAAALACPLVRERLPEELIRIYCC